MFNQENEKKLSLPISVSKQRKPLFDVSGHLNRNKRVLCYFILNVTKIYKKNYPQHLDLDNIVYVGTKVVWK